MLIGYLNTGENTITRPINNTSAIIENTSHAGLDKPTVDKKRRLAAVVIPQKSFMPYNTAFDGFIISETDFCPYTIVKSNRLNQAAFSDAFEDTKNTGIIQTTDKSEDIVQVVKTYINSNQIFADVAVNNKKNKPVNTKYSEPAIEVAADNAVTGFSEVTDEKNNPSNNIATTGNADVKSAKNKDKENPAAALNMLSDKNLALQQKAWIENYAFENKSLRKKFKARLGYQFYITPAVNYRKLSISSNKSSTLIATADIKSRIKQKPGFGFEAGAGVNYALAKKLRLSTGVQLNYTNYNIHADETNHPITTSVLLNDPGTGYSFIAPRTTSTSNTYNSNAVQPVTLHNTTYQLSVPVGLSYKLSSKQNVDWFAGVTAQPTYVFGGKAHIISSDLKNYVSEPSSIRTWNLNLGFETFMNFKLGTYHLQVGPQVRYQVNSTYKKDISLIEKPYAVGLKFGLTKGF